MASGVPIVASGISGYRSVLTQEREGLLVEPGNEMAIVEAVTSLLQNPDARTRMARQGRRTAQQYDWSVVAPRILDYYSDLIEARGSLTREPKRKGFSLDVKVGTTIKIPITLDFRNLDPGRNPMQIHVR